MSYIDKKLARYREKYGVYSGDTFDIFRPNYNIVDNTPSLIASGITYRMDPSSPVNAEPKLKDIDWYELFGKRDILKSGDIFIKTEDDGGMTPPVTFLHYTASKAVMGFRTARICNITNEINNVIYKNVYFDYLGLSFPGSDINKRLESSLRIPNTRIVMFKRDNLFRLSTQIVEVDSTVLINKDGGTPTQFQRVWLVEQIEYTGNLMILTLRQNVDN